MGQVFNPIFVKMLPIKRGVLLFCTLQTLQTLQSIYSQKSMNVSFSFLLYRTFCWIFVGKFHETQYWIEKILSASESNKTYKIHIIKRVDLT